MYPYAVKDIDHCIRSKGPGMSHLGHEHARRRVCKMSADLPTAVSVI